MLAFAVMFSAWCCVSIFRGLLLEELFAQLFVGGVIVGAEITLVTIAIRRKETTPTLSTTPPIVEEFIDFGFDPDEESSTTIDPMDQSVAKWVETKRYLDAEVTIINMASELKTNRTYLSNYINKQYGVTFRDWITALRIKEAKVLLADHSISIAEIASRTGFSTGTTFSRSFARVEGVNPTTWREKR